MFNSKGRLTKPSNQPVKPTLMAAFTAPSRPVRSPKKKSPQLFSPVNDVRTRIIKDSRSLHPSGTRSLNNRHGRFVVTREHPSETKTTEARLRGIKRFLDYEHLVRLIDWEGFDKGHNLDSWKACHYEFCDGGNLREKIDKFPEGLPEGLIWHVLKGVLKGLIYLHTGKKYGHDEESDGEAWRPTVHNLINPENIQFQRTSYVSVAGGLRRPNQWQAIEEEGLYPLVKLSNFGRTKILRAEETTWDPTEYLAPVEWITHFEAPELTWNPENGTYKTASDMWSLGAVAVAMMGGVGEHIEPRLPGTKAEPMSTEAQFTFKSFKREQWSATDLPEKYSRPLRLLVAEFLKLVPKKRIDAERALDLAYWGELAYDMAEAEAFEARRREYMPPEYTDEEIARLMKEFDEEDHPSPASDDFTPSPKRSPKSPSGARNSSTRKVPASRPKRHIPPRPARVTTEQEEDGIDISDIPVETIEKPDVEEKPGNPNAGSHIPYIPLSLQEALRPSEVPQTLGGTWRPGTGQLGKSFGRSRRWDLGKVDEEEVLENRQTPDTQSRLAAMRTARRQRQYVNMQNPRLGSEQDSPTGLGFGRYVRAAREASERRDFS